MPVEKEAPAEAPPPPQRPLHRSPRDYRPDLRPMLILGALLVAVIVGWILLSDVILPPR